jgi:L-aminopeptidase/D-esterase-like protein
MARAELTIAGVPLGRALPDALPELGRDLAGGSCIAIVATDAPLLPHQLKRLARRAPLGIGRTGAIGAHTSGDIFIAFSTANRDAWSRSPIARLEMLSNDLMSPLFAATVQATEEAVINTLVAAKTMTGRDGHTVHAIPHQRLRDILRRHGRLIE